MTCALLLDGVTCGALIGDKGYDADALIERLRQAGVDVVIPPRDNRVVKRACDYVQRWHPESAQVDKWIFCLTTATLAEDQEIR